MAGVTDDLAQALAEGSRPGRGDLATGTVTANNGDGTWNVSIAGDDTAVPLIPLVHVTGLAVGQVVFVGYLSDHSPAVILGRIT